MARNMRTLGRARREMGNEGICSETDVLITAGLTSKKASRLEERARGEYAILAGREGKASREVVGSLDTLSHPLIFRRSQFATSDLSHPLIFRRSQFATSDTYLDPEILALRVLRHRILRHDHR